MTLSDRQQVTQQVRQARLALLDQPLVIRAEDEALYRLVFQHRLALHRWFHDRAGWSLTWDVSHGAFRLWKFPATHTPEWSFGGFSTPKEYVCLALVLWFYRAALHHHVDVELNGSFLLSTLAEAVRDLVHDENDQPFVDFDIYRDRLAMKRVLSWLQDNGLLRWVDGQLDEWAARQRNPDANVLYTFTDHTDRLAAMLDPTVLEDLQHLDPHLAAEPVLDPTASPKERAWRALLLGPVFWQQDDPEAFAYLWEHQHEFDNELSLAFQTEAGHWALDLRPNVAIVLRPDQPPTNRQGWLDIGSAVTQVLALVAARLRQEVAAGVLRPDPTDAIRLSWDEWERFLRDIRLTFAAKWGQTFNRNSSEEYVDLVTSEARRWGCIRGPLEDGKDILVLPAMACIGDTRYEDPPTADRKETPDDHQIRFA